MTQIIFFHLLNDRSGSVKVLSQIIKITNEHKYYTILFSQKNDFGFLNKIAKEQHSIMYWRFNNKFLTLFSYIFSQCFLFIRCLRFFNKDCIFYINTMLPFGAALAAKCMKKKVIYHIHETSIRPKFLKKFLKFNIKLCASKIIFVSNYLQKQEEINTIPQTVIYNAIEAIPLTSLSRNDNHFLVLMVCSLKLFKGIKEFITIASDTESYNYIQYQLILNASPTEIKSFFKTLDVTKNVTIVPRQIDLSPFYKKANLLINLSRPDEWIETFGLTLIEGMQYGLPCIGPCEGGPKEIICDQKDGYLISCYDKNKIIETILKLANDSNLYHRLSTNAMEKVKKFDFSTFKKNIMKELDSIQLS